MARRSALMARSGCRDLMGGKFEFLIYETAGPVASITLNRPERLNAFNAGLRSELLAAVTKASTDAAIRIVVLKGSGASFCAGADLSEGLGGSVTEQIETEYKPFLTGIENSPKLWIAAVQGSAAGIGGALALVCDFLVMEEDAQIYMAFAAIGLIPDGGAGWQLQNALGPRRALEAIVEGQKLKGQRCLELGLANKVVANGKAGETAHAWAITLANGAPLAQAAAKRALREMRGKSLGEAISVEAKLQQALTESEDFRNGVAAFFAKRKPEFSGR
ncbi:MAG: enoyl-CoA hydratase-related protein [Nitratireductor sp.]